MNCFISILASVRVRVSYTDMFRFHHMSLNAKERNRKIV